MAADDGFHLECLPHVDLANATARDIELAFDDDDDDDEERGEHIVLTRSDGSFLHAAGEGDGPYALIFHEEPINRHYRAHAEFSRGEAKEALLDFFHSRTRWWDENDWTEVKHSLPWTLWAGLACLLGGVLLGVLAYLYW